MGQFPLLTLQDILFSKALVDKKIEIYIKECQKHNIIWIEGMIAEFHRIFTSQKIDIKAKIHALFLLKQMVKTCSYPVLMLVQTFLLGFLMEIAEYYARNPSLQKNSKYFQSLGYSPAYPNIQQLSHNYVIMCFQVLFMCAMVRPKQNFQTQELRKNSSFFNSFLKIRDKNHKVFNQTQLKKKLFISQLRDKYKKQLPQFQAHSYFYIDHYMKKLEDYIFTSKINQQTDILDFKILLRKGDSYLTSEAVARLAQMIDFIDEFKIKTRALALLNQMILWGDVQAIITVNYTEYFEKIFKEFFKIDGSKGLQKGQQILRDIKSHPQDKKKFYGDFLRCLQIWAEAFPHQYMIFYDKEESELASPIFKNYRFLKQVRKFIFPENPFLDKMKTETRLNFQQNEQRNKMIINELNKEINELQDFEKVSFLEIQTKMQTAQRYLKKLKQNIVEGSVESMMKHLIKFQNSFELELQRLAQSIEDSILDNTIQKGLICIEIINIIEPEYDKFKRGKITLKDFINFCTKKIDFSRKSLTQISLNSSKSIHDRKSQLKSSITSRINKSRGSIKNMTEQTRIKIIKAKYFERLQKMANRTSSQKDESFLNTSLFLNKKNSQSFSKLPLESAKRIDYKSPENIRQVKSIEKSNHNIPKSPRESGKKVFLVSKYIENVANEDLEGIKNKIIQENWNSNNKIQVQEVRLRPKQPSLMQRNAHFSFVDQLGSCASKEQQSSKNSNKQSIQTFKKSKDNIKLDFVRIVDEIESRSPQSSDMCQSPKFGNTQIRQQAKEDSSNEDKKRFKKGVGLAKQFVNLTQKLIGPKKHMISFANYAQFFPYNQNTEQKKDMLSKQTTIMQTEMLLVDRVTVSSENKLTITFYLFPKEKCSRIRIKILQIPSIYLNVSQSRDIKIQKSYYELKDLKYGEQYEFEVTGNVLKTPIAMPRIVIRVNQDQPENFPIPFPLMHMVKFKKVDSKWLGKEFDLADKMISEEFLRNKGMLGSLEDLDDYMAELTEVKGQKNVRKYRTECSIDKTSFVLDIKQGLQNKMSIQACPLGQNFDRTLIAFYIAECMNFFS